jgi:hypothetical protein
MASFFPFMHLLLFEIPLYFLFIKKKETSMKRFFSLARKSRWAVSGIIAGGILFTACNKSSVEENDTNVAGLMAFNLAADAPSVGFSLSASNLTLNPLAFNSYTGTYKLVYPGGRSLEAYSFISGNTLASTSSFMFEPQKYYSAFLVGTAGSYENVIVNDRLDTLSGTGKAFIRYINAIPDASAPTVTIASNGTNVVNDNAPFKNVSEFVAVDPGTVMVHVTNGGTIEASRSITLEQQGIYTVLLSGKPGDTGETAVQIRYIQNGIADHASGNRIGNATARNVN